MRLDDDDRRSRGSSTGRGASATPTSRRCCPGNYGVPEHAVGLRDAHRRMAACACAITATRSIVGLTLLFALEQQLADARAPRLGAGDRSACSIACWRRRTPDGMLYNEVDAETLAPRATAALRQLGLRLRRGLHLLPGDRRDDVPRRGAARAAQPAEVPQARLGAAPARRPAARLVRRLRRRDRERDLPGEPRAGARGARLDRVGDGGDARRCSGPTATSRTGMAKATSTARALLYALMKSQGVRPGALGAGRAGRRGRATASACAWIVDDAGAPRPMQFDFARHRRVLNFDAELRPPERVSRVVRRRREPALRADARRRRAADGAGRPRQRARRRRRAGARHVDGGVIGPWAHGHIGAWAHGQTT